MPHTKSTTSMPLCKEPAASEATFPCSLVMSPINSSLFVSRSSLYLKKIWARFVTEVCDQVSKAFEADSTALFRSWEFPIETDALTSPVAGLKTSPYRSVVEGWSSPLIQWLMIDAMGSLLTDRF